MKSQTRQTVSTPYRAAPESKLENLTGAKMGTQSALIIGNTELGSKTSLMHGLGVQSRKGGQKGTGGKQDGAEGADWMEKGEAAITATAGAALRALADEGGQAGVDPASSGPQDSYT